MKFSIKDFFSKCDQIRRFLQICSHLLKKSLMENLISEDDTIAIGSMRKFPEGKMYNRCKHSPTLLSTDM